MLWGHISCEVNAGSSLLLNDEISVFAEQIKLDFSKTNKLNPLVPEPASTTAWESLLMAGVLGANE